MVVNLVLNLVLVPILGIEGAAVASLISIGLAALYLLWKLDSLIGLEISHFPGQELVSELVAAGVMGVLVYGTLQIVPRIQYSISSVSFYSVQDRISWWRSYSAPAFEHEYSESSKTPPLTVSQP